MSEPQVLIPYSAAEAIEVSVAAERAKKSAATIRNWCVRYHIGRRVAGGTWQISQVALQMLLDNRQDSLRAYLDGDRHGPLVSPYFEALRAGTLGGQCPIKKIGK